MAILRAHAPFVSPPPVRPVAPSRSAGTPCTTCTATTCTARRPRRPSAAARRGTRRVQQIRGHTHALSTRPPCTSYTTGSRRCPSSTRAPPGTTTIFSGDTPELSARARTHRIADVQHQPMRPFPVHSTTAYTAFLASRRSPNYHSHHYPRAQCLLSLFFIASPELRRLRRRPSASPGCRRRRGTSTRPTSCLRTGSQTRGATGMCSARRRPHLKHREAIVAGARRPSAAQLPIRPPCGTSHRAANPLLRDCDTTSCAL
ncbi:hypothetical protein DFH08DRAFT_329241 [Mycena albidolilacea]|uniref:Uncharacterized protein n=1 Tax=Mycena albidolilacea TaxID=1033008 RepID=A0AAD7AMT0_9AGAR|nr:hypothetical protein DFH08DRAFT_329241 [Mycena albidolilacea]